MSIARPEVSPHEAPAVEAGKQQVPVTVLEPTRGLASLKLGDLWQYRELLFFLVWRDVKVRYKQTALGVAWIVLQPVISTVVFSVLFGGWLGVPSGDAPYPIFALAALVPWTYFAQSLTKASTSLVNSAQLISKVYFPRLIVPLSAVFSGLVDLAVTLVVLGIFMVIYRVAPTWRLATLPIFLLLAMVTALGFGLWLSALNVRYRDVNYLVPFLINIWFYLTPVIYGTTFIPERFRFLLALNPMTVVVEGFRWAVLGEAAPPPQHGGALYLLSLLLVLVVTGSGLAYFKNTERQFADII